jgi:hypothetical protein
MSYEFHNQSFSYARSRQPGDDGHTATMMGQMGKLYLFQEDGPQVAGPVGLSGREHTGENGLRGLQLRKDRPYLRMEGNRAPTVALAPYKHFPFVEIDTGQGEGRFGNAPAMANAKEEGNCQPSFRDGQESFAGQEGVAYNSLLLEGYFWLLPMAGGFHFHPGNGAGGNEPPLDSLAHDATEKADLFGRSMYFGASRAPVALTPCEVVLSDSVGQAGGVEDVYASEEASEETPMHQFNAEGAGLGHIGEECPNVALHPCVPIALLSAGGGRSVAALGAGQVVSVLPSQGVDEALSAALHLPLFARAIPYPPIGGASSFVDATRHAEANVTECNSPASRNGTLRGEVGIIRSIPYGGYSGHDTSRGVLPLSECSNVTNLSGGVEAGGHDAPALLGELGDTQNNREPDAWALATTNHGTQLGFTDVPIIAGVAPCPLNPFWQETHTGYRDGAPSTLVTFITCPVIAEKPGHFHL